MSVLDIDRILDGVDTLPQLPDVTLRIIRVLNDPRSNFRSVVDVVRFDQTVTTELLRLCNSAAFGVSRRVTSLEDAVRLLGTARVMQLVLAAHTHALLGPAQAGYGLLPGSLWTHSVGVSLAAQAIATRIGYSEVGACFTAALLHDIGKIVLNEYVSREYGQIAALVAQERVAFYEAEMRVLGFTHAEVGAIAAERWNLPASIVSAIRYHHAPSTAPEPSLLLDAVHLADTTAILIGIGGGDDGLHYRADQAVVARHGLLERDFEMVGLEVIMELKTVCESFRGAGS